MDHIGLVSFDREETPNAFLAVDPENVNTNFEATLKIKTLEGYGLIMYLTNDDQVISRIIHVYKQFHSLLHKYISLNITFAAI